MRRSPYINMSRRRQRRCLIGDFSSGMTSAKDEAALGIGTASDYKNFRLDRGVLTDGWGLVEGATFGSAKHAISAWEYVSRSDGREIRLPMYCDGNGCVHEIRKYSDTILQEMTFSSAPIAMNYRLYGKDVLLLCSPSDGMAVYDGESLRAVKPAPLVTGMTLHYERLFVTTANEPNCVRFSDDLDPTNWAEDLESGGFVQLADDYGKSNTVLSFLNYVYIFRDYGISRMVAYADQREFSVSNLYVSSGKIYPRSVTACGDRVVFLASDGLYAFDGLDTTRILTRLGDITPYKETAVGRYFDGKYYLAFAKKKEGCNDSLLVYDIASGITEISEGFPIEAFYQGNELLVLSDGRIMKLAPCGSDGDTPTHKVWRVPLGALSRPDTVKRIVSVCLETATDIEMTALADGRQRRVKVRGREGVQCIRLGLTGRKIGLQISTDCVGTKISSLSFIVSDS